MSDDIPQWAKKRVCQMANAEPTKPDCFELTPDRIGPGGLAAAFARYIAAHEQEPVDPLLIEAREIAASSNDERGFPGIAESYRAGTDDNSEEVRLALAAIKRGIELGRASK